MKTIAIRIRIWPLPTRASAIGMVKFPAAFAAVVKNRCGTCLSELRKSSKQEIATGSTAQSSLTHIL